jgi:predicted O-linked N-acetylglucosamine transferase (SPINDLY family)
MTQEMMHQPDAHPPLEDALAEVRVCGNNPLKVSSAAIRTWAQVLHRVPESKLELLAEGSAEFDADGADLHLMHQRFAAQGIPPQRVKLVGRQDRAAYFEWLHSADIALDPFPYNGGVSTCDALWMGVPVVALAGNAYWSRQGAAIVSQIGLHELIGHSEAEYVRIAVELALDQGRLAHIRSGLRQLVGKSPICDCEGCVEAIETAMRFWTRGGT